MPRTLIAAVLGLAGFAAYVAAAVILGDTVTHAAWPLQLSYFLVAGTLWVVPARWLILWGARRR